MTEAGAKVVTKLKYRVAVSIECLHDTNNDEEENSIILLDDWDQWMENVLPYT